jgi:hypothetical protein
VRAPRRLAMKPPVLINLVFDWSRAHVAGVCLRWSKS